MFPAGLSELHTLDPDIARCMDAILEHAGTIEDQMERRIGMTGGWTKNRRLSSR